MASFYNCGCMYHQECMKRSMRLPRTFHSISWTECITNTCSCVTVSLAMNKIKCGLEVQTTHIRVYADITLYTATVGYSSSYTPGIMHRCMHILIVSWYGNTTVDLQYRIAGHFCEVKNFAFFDGRAVNAKIKTGINSHEHFSL